MNPTDRWINRPDQSSSSEEYAPSPNPPAAGCGDASLSPDVSFVSMDVDGGGLVTVASACVIFSMGLRPWCEPSKIASAAGVAFLAATPPAASTPAIEG